LLVGLLVYFGLFGLFMFNWDAVIEVDGEYAPE
jgi:hypothetical protein